MSVNYNFHPAISQILCLPYEQVQIHPELLKKKNLMTTNTRVAYIVF